MDTSIDFSQLSGWEDSDRQSIGAIEEDALIRAAASGCEDSFRQLVEWHQETIYRFCFQWLHNAEDAREACQDTFVRAHQALDRYQRKGRLTTWLYQIALNRCRDHQKSRFARQRRDTAPFPEASGEIACYRASPDEQAARSGDLEKLRQGINQLPPRLRAALILTAVEGLSQEECALVLKCSVRAVEGRVYRARRDLLAWWNRAV